jgi:hypothetical protein
MTNRRKFVVTCSVTCSLLAGGALAQAQTPPAPPAPPSPPPAMAPMAAPVPMAAPMPQPAVAPMPPVPPVPPRAFEFDGGDFNFDFNINIDRAAIEEQAEAARAMAEQAREEARAMADEARENMRLLEPKIATATARAFATTPFAFAPQVSVGYAKPRNLNGSENSLYQRGTSALDGKRWDDAVAYFGEVAAQKGSRADGALYWKAYALKKLGKSNEALAAIAELRKSYASSRWLDDAKALELDLGKPVSPESEADEELKLLALNGIMQSDPERAIPLVENQLKSSASPRVKKNALFVLAQSSNPKAQAAIEQIARGGSNPDLQVKAIMFLTERRRPNAGQVLSEIYAASNDPEVKRAVLQAYVSNRDKDRLVAAIKNEKNPELRSIGINYLGSVQGNPELWQLYQAETTVDGKEQILRAMWNNGNAGKLLEVIRTEKEPRLRRLAIQVYGSQKSQATTDTLVQIYNSEQDQQIKNAILDSLNGAQHATALIAMAKAEKDPKMKLRIVERISNMAGRSKEAQQYLEELLK